MMEFKTLDYDEIDLFLTSRSMKKLRKQRDEAEKRRKSSTGGMSTLLGNCLKTMTNMEPGNDIRL